MLRESEFIRQLRTLLSGRVSGLDDQRKLDIIKRLSEEYSAGASGSSLECYWVPFVTGRRPGDEATYPGLGSSDHVALIRGSEGTEENRCYLLYRIAHLEHLTDEEIADSDVRVTLSFAGPWGDLTTEPLPTWNSRKVKPRTFVSSAAATPVLTDATLRDSETRALVVELSPEGDFLPGEAWGFADLDATIRARATDSEDPFTFGSLFMQQVRAEIVLSRGGVPVSASEELIDVCDSHERV